ncbi:MAG: MBL fold metallo-hydrolase [Candidatus Thermoplasmatota archaeon]|jgi:glyoxylase-like metal-dependent hydrolase (beta-lactamase superfamily II)|nr:MBL fold metallo-hydrolase [Candidatus Thermoplasmatota archaeon]
MRISDNVQLIEGTMANCYYLKINENNILVDSGTKSSAKKIIRFFEGLGISPNIVLITHDHPDHIGGLSMIFDRFKPKIYANKIEIPTIQGKERMRTAGTFMSKVVGGLMKSMPVQDVFSIDELKIKDLSVVETPGHTAGSTSFFYEPERMIFVGDAVVVHNGELSINKQFTTDMNEAKKSEEKIRSYSPVTILPGHGKPINI